MHGLATLLRKSWWSLRNLRTIIREQSLFKLVFVLLFTAGLITGLWFLFLEGFRFLDALGGIGLMIINRLFGLFFFGMGLMLVISAAIAAYSTIYQSDEMPFLLMRPIGLNEVLLYKYLESAAFASWAFFLIIVPFVGAYTAHENLSIWFLACTLLFSIPFVLLCSGLGTILCVLLVRWFPPMGVLMAGLLVVAVLVAVGIMQIGSIEDQASLETTIVLSRLLPGVRLASHPLWPSWWVSEGIMSLSHGQWDRGLKFFAVLIANFFMAALLVDSLAPGAFHGGWLRAVGTGSRSRTRTVSLNFLNRALGMLKSDVRAMILKDIRVFLRDPAQWTQGLIFFGLLGIYFLNLRHLQYHLLPDAWRNLITFLNVFGVSAVLCSFGTRFLYPQPSLESHGFWIIGMSPTGMKRVVAAKFGWGLTLMGVISVGLMYLSSNMLGMPIIVKISAMCIAAGMSIAISGLSVGLGTIYLDLKQRNPAAIISGFGGTLNLVLCLGFMLVVIVPYGAIFHFHYLGYFDEGSLRLLLIGVFCWLLSLTIITCLIPLRIGQRSLMRREF